MAATKIEWADAAWNPITGCTPISEACDHCYARRMATRLAGRYGYDDKKPFGITEHTDKFKDPCKTKKPTRFFVCSMGDLFHESISFNKIASVLWYATREESKKHTFLLLTKRPERMRDFFAEYYKLGPDFCGETPVKNFWLGVTAENQARADERVSILRRIPAAVRFVSVEPMLGPVDLGGVLTKPTWEEIDAPDGFGQRLIIIPRNDLIHWVICGGETGPGARPMHPDWVRSLRDQCTGAGVPLFFKSWGEWGTKAFNMTTGEPSFRMFDSFQQWVNKANWIQGGICIDMAGRICKNGGDMESAQYPVAIMHRVCKKAAGRVLDGREWSEFPDQK